MDMQREALLILTRFACIVPLPDFSIKFPVSTMSCIQTKITLLVTKFLTSTFFPPKQLDLLLKSLGFTQKKADSQVRWSVLNTVLILRRHERAREKLAEAMSTGKSVGACIGVIEENIDDTDV